MRPSMDASVGRQIYLSTNRIKHLLSGNRDVATHMGWRDKFMSLVRGDKKEEELGRLFDQLNSNNSVDTFHAFNKLSKMASPGNRSLFTVDVAPNESLYPDGSRISYCIDGHAVKVDTITAEQWKTFQLKLGVPTEAQYLRGLMTTLDNHERETCLAIQDLTNEDFKVGGVNKQFAPRAGVLKSCNRTGNEDFKREGELRAYAENFPAMASYLSTQEEIKAPQGVDPNFQYAKVVLYNEDVSSSELGGGLAQLSESQVKSVSVQLVDMLKEFYLGKLSHLDLHMNNLIVHKRNRDDAVFLRAIDFGHAKFGDGFNGESYKDIDYVFNRLARSQLETLSRNYLRRADSEKMQKHYPLHKLLQQAGAQPEVVARTLSAIGNLLKADLQIAGDAQDRVSQAFARASASVQMALDNAYHPKRGVGLKV
ncbi:hypothetical protein D3C77_233170 [compost metagenome]